MREANQAFARCVRDVEAGEEFLITRNGVPVARLVAAPGKRTLTLTQQAAWERTRERMKTGWPIGAGKIDRDELHER